MCIHRRCAATDDENDEVSPDPHPINSVTSKAEKRSASGWLVVWCLCAVQCVAAAAAAVNTTCVLNAAYLLLSFSSGKTRKRDEKNQCSVVRLYWIDRRQYNATTTRKILLLLLLFLLLTRLSWRRNGLDMRWPVDDDKSRTTRNGAAAARKRAPRFFSRWLFRDCQPTSSSHENFVIHS